MASVRLILSSCSRLGGISAKSVGSLQAKQVKPAVSYATRFFSKDGDDEKKKEVVHDDDPFGVNFEDGTDHGKLGPTIPPRYKRDAMTGKFTGEEETEITEKQRKLLKMDPVQEQEYLLEKVFNDWDISDEDEEEGSQKLSKFAQRVRQDSMGMNILGRSVEAQSQRGKLEDGEDEYSDETGFSKPLSPAEFKVFQEYMKDKYKTEIDEDDIPVEHVSEDDSVLGGYADNEYLNTKWMSSSAVRFMDDTKDDDPFSDLLPSDLSPARLVNRQKAKAIPRKLLHHNNLALLRRYMTPTGQIMNRVQSRLGAKDQRRISKLIKRARHLGLLPTAGQFTVEAHGSIHERDIDQEKEWEMELVRRGLVVKSQSAKKGH
jgi:small subunit ribosomal protein S18